MEKNGDRAFGVICTIVIIAIVGIVVTMFSNDKEISNNFRDVTYSEYKEKIKSSTYTIVLLSRPNCGYCQDYRPLMNRVLEEFGLEAQVLNVNSLNDEEKNELHGSISVLRQLYDEKGKIIISTPTTILYANGKEVAAEIGNIGDTGLRKFLVKNGVVDNENL